MEFSEIQLSIKSALELLNQRDKSLMSDNLNERAIAHQFAVKLARKFIRLNVDCEYNGNIEAKSKRKEIQMLNNKLRRFKSKKYKPHLPATMLIDLSITPDIIIHKRGKNINNLLIIEIKKSTNTSQNAFEFDDEKVRAYTLIENYQTSKEFFHYKYGLLLIVGCLNKSNDELIWYENGVVKCSESLLKSTVLLNTTHVPPHLPPRLR